MDVTCITDAGRFENTEPAHESPQSPTVQGAEVAIPLQRTIARMSSVALC